MAARSLNATILATRACGRRPLLLLLRRPAQ